MAWKASLRWMARPHSGITGLIIFICVQLSTISRGYFPAGQVLIKSQEHSSKDKVKDRCWLPWSLTMYVCRGDGGPKVGTQGAGPYLPPKGHPQGYSLDLLALRTISSEDAALQLPNGICEKQLWPPHVSSDSGGCRDQRREDSGFSDRTQAETQLCSLPVQFLLFSVCKGGCSWSRCQLTWCLWVN